MCRLSAYFGAPICAADLVTKPNRSIVRQSFDARERMSGDAATPGYLNGDGFGLGWYAVDRHADPIPCTYRQARPAWHDTNLRNISAKVITPVLFAHVRATTAGQCVSEATCHPFRAGRYLWMHNGGVGGYGTVRRTLLAGLDDACFDYAQSNGPSDSSLCFAIFLNQLRKTMGNRQPSTPVGVDKTAHAVAVGGSPDAAAKASTANGPPGCGSCTETNTVEYCGFDGDLPVCTPDQLRERLEETILIIKAVAEEAGVTEMSLLNFVVSDGNALVATRYVINSADPDAPAASLYWSSGNRYSCETDGDEGHPAGRLIEADPSDGVLPPPEGSYSMQHTDRRATLAMVSSEPLTDDRTDWVSVPRNHVLVITPCIHVLVSPIGVRGSAISPALASLTAYNQEAAVVAPTGGTSPAASPAPTPRTQALRSALRSPAPPLNKAGSCRFRLRGHANPVLSMAVLEPYLFSGAQDGSVRVWDLRSRSLTAVLASHRGGVLALATDAKRRLLYSAAADSSICIWRVSEDAGGGAVVRLGQAVGGAPDDPLSPKQVALPALGRVLSGSALNGLSGRSDAGASAPGPHFHCVRRVTCDSWGDIFSLAIVDGRLHAGFRDTCVRWTDVSEAVLAGGPSSVGSSSGDDSGCESTSSGPPLTVLGVDAFVRPRLSEPAAQHCSYVFALVGRGHTLVTGCGDGLIRVFDAATGRLLRVLHGHRSGVLALAMTGDESEPEDANGVPNGTEEFTPFALSAVSSDVQRQASLRSPRRRSSYGNLLFSGSRDKTVKVWDADSGFACKRTLAHGDDVLSVELGPGVLLTGQADGVVRVWSLRTLTCTRAFHCGSLETLAVSVPHGALFTASRDGEILAWDLADPAKLPMLSRSGRSDKAAAVLHVPNGPDAGECLLSRAVTDAGEEDAVEPNEDEAADGAANGLDPKVAENRELEDALAAFVSLQSVSGSTKAEHREDCWQAAKWLSSLLEDWGAAVQLATAADSAVNPLILARFTSPHTDAPTVAFYAHYDVMPADGANWKTDPFSLSSINGYLYGRGSTDDKGPLLAFAFAVKELTKQPLGLPVNVVFAVEGHGESSNFGFREMVEAHRRVFEGVDLILISNSYWSGDRRPCLTYGMRGALDVEVRVSGPPRNLHSGVDGGAIVEPVNDLITVLSTLVDSRGIGLVPGFFDGVRPFSEEDRDRLAAVEHMDGYRTRTGCTSFTSNNEEELLQKRWLLPSLSVTSITTSNVAEVSSIIPRAAFGKVSVRFVPDQQPAAVLAAVTNHLRHEFGKRRSPNQLDVACTSSGDWWLGTPTGAEYALAERALSQVWGEPPLYVREGGTMPIVSYLSRTLDAPVVQVPLGQASDGAHLPNERIRALNLHNGKRVFKLMLSELAAAASGQAAANGVRVKRGISRSSTQSLSSPLPSCASSPPTSSGAELMAAADAARAANDASASFVDLSASLSKRLSLKKMALFEAPLGTHHS